MSILRPYQQQLVNDTYAQWQSGVPNVLGVLPTGGGKSVVSAHMMLDESLPSMYTAHRAELVLGESLALARNGVRHRVIGPPALRRECSRLHVGEGLYDHVDMNAVRAVGSVDTILNLPAHDPYLLSLRLVIPDEAAHVLAKNKWGRMLGMMKNVAHIFGPTATPYRADGKGLGRHADGVFDAMVLGPTPRELELMGNLVPHRIFAPPSDLDLSDVPVTAGGDYSQKPLEAAVRKSHIVGDVVGLYVEKDMGKLGMTFCVSVEESIKTAAAFRAAGVRAEVVTGDTPADLRNAIFRKYRAREFHQLVGVGVFTEGTDVAEVEVISLARPSESESLITQMIGRGKRTADGKLFATVNDHCGNVARHYRVKWCGQTGDPYIAVGERDWTLDRRERRTASRKPLVAVTTCIKCLRTYERVIGRTCPYCSHTVEPAGRSAPEQVDGVLSELDPRVLAGLTAAVAHVDGAPTIPYGATPAVQGAVIKRHRERQEAQQELRRVMALWGGWLRYGEDVERAQRAFYLEFGVDVATAQALGRAEADALRERVAGVLGERGVMV